MASGHVNRAERSNYGCTDQACDVKILLANSEPSTHGPFRRLPRCSDTSIVGGPADIIRASRKSRLNRGARLIQTTELCQGGSKDDVRQQEDCCESVVRMPPDKVDDPGKIRRHRLFSANNMHLPHSGRVDLG